VPTFKTCASCGDAKIASPEFFHVDRLQRDGLTRVCKQCRTTRQNELRHSRGVRNLADWRAQKVRVCKVCGVEKDLAEYATYYRSGSRKCVCKACEKGRVAAAAKKAKPQRRVWAAANKDRVAAMEKKWRANNKESTRLMILRSRLKRAYGITPERRLEMLKEQEGACAICKEPISITQFGHAIDHNHTTGRVRALLCQRCNTGLGSFKDSVAILRAAADYLDEHNEGA